MRVAIMQPTYLPWSGYFGLFNYVDFFVFLDSVQFERRSWQQRNKIKSLANVVTLWQTVDRPELIKTLARLVPAANILIQVNVLQQKEQYCPHFFHQLY